MHFLLILHSSLRRSALRSFLFLLIGIYSSASVLAQEYLYEGYFWNAAMDRIAASHSSWGWVDFREDAGLNPQSLFRDHAGAFNLGDDDQLVLVKVNTDAQVGHQHYRYQHYYKGLKVRGSEYIVHTDETGLVRSANGKLVSGLSMNTNPSISERAAFNLAMAHADGNTFLWMDQAAEMALKEQRKDPDATYYPVGELMIQRLEMGFDFRPSNYRLAWAFDFYMGLEGEARRVYIDAMTGQFLNYLPLSMSCSSHTGNTIWYGSRPISTRSVLLAGIPVYRLEDHCFGDHPYEINTYDLQRTSSTSSLTNYINLSSSWTDADDLSGVTAHWAAHRTRDYLANVHAWESWNGAGAAMNTYNEAMVFGGHNNACWNCFSNVAAFGGGSESTPNDDWNTLDIVGHEFTHGVIRSSANLTYSYESGALNESFADIFGEMVESYALGTPDWLIGADRGPELRNFMDPHLRNMPKTYLGLHWRTGTGDAGGVHYNSSVQNHWFYLLSNGGSGVNDNGDAFSVTGIGRFNARQIAFRSLTVYLTADDQYSDARKAAIRAANDLYGSCSVQAIETGKAWYAVGVGTGWNTGTICGPINTVSFPYSASRIDELAAGGTCNNNVIAHLFPVTYRSAGRVVLRPGFTAVSVLPGNRFVAKVEDCTYTVFRPGAEMDGVAPHPDTHFDVEDHHGHNHASAEYADTRVTPNPASDQITLFLPVVEDGFQLRVTDMAGRLMLEQLQIQESQWSVQVNDWPSGLYLLELKSKHSLDYHKLVVE